MRRLLLPLALLAGCGYDIETFNENLSVAYCDYSERCFDQTDCEVTLEADCGDSAFDPEKADACLEELETAECEGDEPSLPRYCLEPCTDE